MRSSWKKASLELMVIPREDLELLAIAVFLEVCFFPFLEAVFIVSSLVHLF